MDNQISFWLGLEKAHLGLLDSVGRSAERLREETLCCLEHRRKVNAPNTGQIYHRADYPMHKYLRSVVAALNTRASAARCELAIVI